MTSPRGEGGTQRPAVVFVPAEAPGEQLRSACASLAGGLTACLYYAISRSIAAWGESGPPDPSAPIGYYTRIATAAALGLLIAAVVHRVDREARLFPLLERATWPLVGLCVALSLLLP